MSCIYERRRGVEGGVGWREIGGGIRPAVDTFCLAIRVPKK